MGNRTHQTIETVASAIRRYFDVPVKVSGVEMVSEPANTKRELVPGAGIDVVSSGQVLAYNSDSYPIIVSHAGGRVVYCAFDSDSDPGLRLLIGGIVRDVLGIQQEVRLLDGERVASDVLTSLRQDWKEANIRYLMVVNMLPRPMDLKVDLESGWRVIDEKMHGAASLPGGDGRRVHLGASDVALFGLARLWTHPSKQSDTAKKRFKVRCDLLYPEFALGLAGDTVEAGEPRLPCARRSDRPKS